MSRFAVLLSTAILVNACRDPDLQGPARTLAQFNAGAYRIVDLGTLDTTHNGGGGGSQAWAVNSLGQVVGFSRTGIGEPAPYGAQHAFVWEQGVITDLGTLGGAPNEQSTARFINERGQIVGWSEPYASAATRAVIWDGGVVHDIGTLGGDRSMPSGLSDAGHVVGSSTIPSGASHAFLWWNGVMQDLGTLGGNASSAAAVNDVGQVAGESQTAGGNAHAFLWDGAMHDLAVQKQGAATL